MKKSIDVYDKLYHSDLKHLEKNLASFVSEKKRNSVSSRTASNSQRTNDIQ